MTTTAHRDAGPLERTVPPPPARVGALARNEAGRLFRHPAVWMGAALSAFFFLSAVNGLGERAVGEHSASYVFFVGFAALPLAGGTLVATNLTALRPRRSRSEELFGAAAMTPGQRTLASLLAIVPVAALAAAMAAVSVAVMQSGTGMRLMMAEGAVAVRPSALELAQGPLAVTLFGALGIVLARAVPHPAASMVLVPVYLGQLVDVGWMGQSARVVFWPVAHPIRSSRWVSLSPASGYPFVEGLVRQAVAWHLLYVVGVIALLAALALWRRTSARALLSLAGAGSVAVAVGAAMQLSRWTA